MICLEARQVSAALAAMRNKTDRNDARGIAQILRTGWYGRVHKSLHSHQIRLLLSSRRTVLSKCVDLENELSCIDMTGSFPLGLEPHDDLPSWARSDTSVTFESTEGCRSMTRKQTLMPPYSAGVSRTSVGVDAATRSAGHPWGRHTTR